MPGRRRLDRADPEEHGVASTELLAFVEGLVEIPELHSVMVLRHGAVVAEGWASPYAPDRLHELFSLSKSFTSTAVGLARGEGLLSLDDLLVEHFPEHAALATDPAVASMRLRHLLTMTTGHDEDPSDTVFSSPDWAAAFLALPVQHEPGTHFTYNTPATYMLSAVVQKVTGERVLDYLRPRLLEPLGITGVTWERSPQHIDTGGFGLSATTEDIAALGQLYLADGVWRGRRLLPEGWVAEATSAQVPNGTDPASDWAQGYGYQFWRNRVDGYRGDGAFGQLCVVLPRFDAVVAITAGVDSMQDVLDVLDERLVPGLADVPLPPDPVARAALTARLESLRLDPAPFAASSPTAERLSGRRLVFDSNEIGLSSVVLDVGADRDRLTIVMGARSVVLEPGHGQWVPGRVRTHRGRPEAVLVAAGWSTPETYVVTVRLVETPFVATITATVTDDDVAVEACVNLAFGPTRLAPLFGALEDVRE